MTKKTDSAEFTAAAAALDKNSVALSEAIGSVYGEERRRRLPPLWRKHIGFFVDYTVGKADQRHRQGDQGQGRPRRLPGRLRRLPRLGQPQPDKDAVAEALVPHVTATFAAIDGVVAGDGTGVREAADRRRAHADDWPTPWPARSPSSSRTSSPVTRLGRLRASGHADRRSPGARVPGRHRRRHGRDHQGPELAASRPRPRRSTRTRSTWPRRSTRSTATKPGRVPRLWRKHIGFFVDYTHRQG